FHVAQVSARMAGLILSDDFVKRLDHRLGMPVGCTTIPMVEPDFATKVQHQRLESRGRIEFEADLMQLFFGWHEFGAKTAQVFDKSQRMLLLFEEPHGHERAKVAVVAVV